MNEIKLSKEEIFRKEEEVKKGSSWFLWIALLSIINSIIVASGGNLNFILGLGVTQIIDGLTIYSGLDKSAGLLLNLIITSIFFLFAYFARQKKTWAFITGMVLYGLDGLLFLPVQDYLGFGFHVFALIMLFKGFQAMRVLNKIEVPLIEVTNLAAQSSNTFASSLIAEEQVSAYKCPSCGAELKEYFKYCSSCGMRIQE